MVAVCCVQARKVLLAARQEQKKAKQQGSEKAKQQGSGKTAWLPFVKGAQSYASGEPLSCCLPPQV